MNRAVWIGLVAALIAAAGLWLYQSAERETAYELESWYQGLARRNGFHAAERLLTRLGLGVHSVRSLAELPEALPADAVLILGTPSYALRSEQLERLLGWVEDGGHLIATVHHAFNPARNGDVLLERLGVTVAKAGAKATEPVAVRLGDGDAPLQVNFASDLDLQDPEHYASWAVTEAGMTPLIQYDWGDGLITLVNDLGVFANDRIGDHDHGDLLWGLLHLERREPEVWIQYAPQLPSFLEVLWRYGWTFLVGLALSLAAAVWAGSRRLGPLLAPRPDASRSLLDHVRASGGFLWRAGEGKALLDAARSRVLQTLERRHPRWQGMSVAAQIDYLAVLTGLERARVEALLNPAQAVGEHDFLRMIQALHDIENEL